MTELVATMIGALIAAAALYITTGPALGAVRSRRALRELLDIRSSLTDADTARRAQINEALDEEFKLLVSLGDTSQRYAVAAMTVLGGLVVIAWVTIAVPTFLIQEGHKELMRYISAGAFLLACVPLYPVVKFASERVSNKRYQAVAVGIGLLVFVALVSASLVVIQETTYYRQLTAL